MTIIFGVIAIVAITALIIVLLGNKPQNIYHSFGTWELYNEGEDDCENMLYYRICEECSTIEWRDGEYEDHAFSTVTTAPTCQAGGYDTKTCEICGKVEICNETPVADHSYINEYIANNSYHWLKCADCDAIGEEAEHKLSSDSTCIVCCEPIGPTGGIVYDISADGTYAEVIGYSGIATKIKIAEEYDGLPVKTIYSNAFKGNRSITSVIIPDSVTSIGDNAFYSCYSLSSAVIGNSVTSIGDNAFYSCHSLTSAVIGNSVTSIGDSAFSCCDSLISIVLPDSVATIGDNAFANSNNLASIVIPDTVTSIGAYAFSFCSKLITEYDYCRYVGSENNPYHVLIDTTNVNLSTYTLHPDTKVIADTAFSSCARLSSITIPDSVTSVGDAAFYGCSSLSDIYYTGSEDDWSRISISDNNYEFINAYIHYNYIEE